MRKQKIVMLTMLFICVIMPTAAIAVPEEEAFDSPVLMDSLPEIPETGAPALSGTAYCLWISAACCIIKRSRL